MSTNKKPASTSTDAIVLLRKDHATARKLLRELEKTETEEVDRRRTLLEEVASEVEIHAKIEEEIFYPAFHQKAEEGEDEKLFYEAEEEHDLVHKVLPLLRSTDPSSELFSARAKVLKDLVEHHAEEEEKELFPRVRELMDRETLRDLGMQLKKRKTELQRTAS
jgi:hemerythrin-like domain-containing protein